MKASLPLLFLIAFSLSLCTVKAQYQVEPVYTNVTVTDPVEAVVAGQHLYIVAQRGVIHRLPLENEGASGAITFLDIAARVTAGGEKGLLGLAFHPQFQSNGYFYVNYTTDNPLQTRISRFTVNPANPAQADPTSELVLLTFNQPFENHNGGKIAFGPDGFLYIASGDGGSGGDPQNNAQNRQSLLGKLLRIDVNSASNGRNYSIPADNPYANNTTRLREEIYAFGLRNPWKFSFDSGTGVLWLADVGQNSREEINIIKKGGNYGWPIMEGKVCNKVQNCTTEGLELPVYEYTHASGAGRSVTGGFVYRGTNLPELQGKYIYADFISGNIWALGVDAAGNAAENALLVRADFLVAGFAEDQDKELLVLRHGSNRNLYRLTSTVTGIADLAAAGIVVYPNPAHSTLHINLENFMGGKDAKLSLYNNLGQLVQVPQELKKGRATERVLQVKGLPKGLYVLQVEVQEKRFSKKVLLQ